MLKYDTIEKQDPNAATGSRTVTAKGVNGLQQVTYVETYLEREADLAQGRQGHRAAPAGRRGGRGRAGAAAGTAGRVRRLPNHRGGSNWCGLARCESGVNPNAYNPAGPYYGLYQFDEGTWRSIGGTGSAERPLPRRADPRA